MSSRHHYGYVPSIAGASIVFDDWQWSNRHDRYFPAGMVLIEHDKRNIPADYRISRKLLEQCLGRQKLEDQINSFDRGLM